MSLLSEIIIRPGTSNTYIRLIFILFLISVVLIIHSAINFFIQLVLIVLIITQFGFECVKKSPCSEIREIRFYQNRHIVLMTKQAEQSYTDAEILIHNVLFQLIVLSNFDKRKKIVLFNDQIPISQLRELHLKITIQ